MSEDDLMAELLRQMQQAAGNGAGPGTDEDTQEEFSKMLLGMMEQLTHKDILYEPMRELHDKFPGWMAANRERTARADLERYELQQTLVAEIVARFEMSSYSDDNTADREYIMDRMQRVRKITSCRSDARRMCVADLTMTDASYRSAAGRPCGRHAVGRESVEHA